MLQIYWCWAQNFACADYVCSCHWFDLDTQWQCQPALRTGHQQPSLQITTECLNLECTSTLGLQNAHDHSLACPIASDIIACQFKIWTQDAVESNGDIIGKVSRQLLSKGEHLGGIIHSDQCQGFSPKEVRLDDTVCTLSARGWMFRGLNKDT